jgi:hypothetical protein
MVKRIVVKIVNVIAGIGILVFWFMPLSTFTQILLCVGSFAIAIICIVVSKNLDDSDPGSGYWPRKPTP